MDDKRGSEVNSLLDLIFRARLLPLFHVVAKLEIADHLKNGPKSAKQLATDSRCQPEPLGRVLRSLVAVGLFRVVPPNLFEVTSLGTVLQLTHPQSLHSVAVMIGEPYFWRPWGELLHTVKTGKPAFNHCFGVDSFQYFTEHPEAGKVFSAAMTGASRRVDTVVGTCLPPLADKTIVDIGGGEGSLIEAVLEQHRGASGILVDLPGVIKGARKMIRSKSVAERLTFVPGDFFRKNLPQGDIFLLKKVIHDWGDADSVRILKNCRRSMSNKSSRLYLIEVVLSQAGSDDLGTLLMDIEMLVMTEGGKERTREQFARLLEKADLNLNRVLTTETGSSLIEAGPL